MLFRSPLNKYVVDRIIPSTKILLAKQQLTHIAPKYNNSTYPNVRRLYISNNDIQSLDGIQCFKNLEQISLNYNQLLDIEEVVKLGCIVSHLLVRGNFLDRNPDYRRILIEHFPKLVLLDELEISWKTREDIKDSFETETKIIPFIQHLLDKHKKFNDMLDELNIIIELKNSGMGSTINIDHYIETSKNFMNISKIIDDFTMKPIMNSYSLKKLMTQIGFINENALDKDTQMGICESLYKNMIMQLRLEGERDLERYLCYQVLKNDIKLFEQLKKQIDINNPKVLLTYSKYMEYCVELLIKGICHVDYDMLAREQFKHFLKFCHYKGIFNENHDSIKYNQHSEGKKQKKTHCINNKKIYSITNENSNSNNNGDISYEGNLTYNDNNNDIVFPLFPFNQNYLRALKSLLHNKLNNIKTLHKDMLNLLLENFPEARSHFIDEYNDPNSEWLAKPNELISKSDKLNIYKDNTKENIETKYELDSNRKKKLIEVGEKLLNKVANQQFRKYFLRRLKEVGDERKKKLDKLVNILQKNMKKFIMALKTPGINNSKENLNNYSKSNIRGESDALKNITNNENNKEINLEKPSKEVSLTKGKLLYKIINPLSTKILQRDQMKEYFDKWNKLRKAFNKYNTTSSINKFTTAETNTNFQSFRKNTIHTSKSSYIEFENRINELIKNTVKLEKEYSDKLDKINNCKGKFPKTKSKLCSIDCNVKVPKYLEQKRLNLRISVNPLYRTKTMTGIAKII